MESEVYKSGQLRSLCPYLRRLARVPKWLLLGGPADGDEAQCFVQEYPDAAVLACEPCPELLSVQRDRGFPGVLLDCALSDSCETAMIKTDGRCTSFLQERSGKLLSVPTTTLDKLHAQHGPFRDAVLWLDIEGSEFRALRGAEQLFCAGAVMLANVEVLERLQEHTEGIERFFERHGFVLADRWNLNEGSHHDRIYIRREDLKGLGTARQLLLFADKVRRREPFCHLRFNDGEAKTMFRLVSDRATTSGEHRCYRDLGAELLRAWTEILTGHKDNVYVGSFLFREPQAPGAQALLQTVGDSLCKMNWCMGDLWYSTEAEVSGKVSASELLQLCNVLRESRRCVLVCNEAVAPAAGCLGADCIIIPKKDAWLDRSRLLAKCLEHCRGYADSVFVWCAGLPAKVWAWQLFKEFPQTTHLDAGHLFDEAFGRRNREWQTRSDWPHSRCYANEITPYVRRHAK